MEKEISLLASWVTGLFNIMLWKGAQGKGRPGFIHIYIMENSPSRIEKTKTQIVLAPNQNLQRLVYFPRYFNMQPDLEPIYVYLDVNSNYFTGAFAPADVLRT